MKKLCCLFIVVGLLMVALTLPSLAASETQSADAAEETQTESLEEEIEIQEEDVPLAGLPGVGRADVARIIVGAGCCMMIVAGAILITGIRRGHVRR